MRKIVKVAVVILSFMKIYFRYIISPVLLILPLILWKWRPWGVYLFNDKLLMQLLHGMCFASGLLLLQVIDTNKLGSFAEAFIALCTGLIVMLFGRVWSSAGFVIPSWQSDIPLSNVFQVSLPACLLISLLLVRCIQCCFTRKFSGFDLQHFALLLSVTLLACFTTDVLDRATFLSNNMYLHQIASWNEDLWVCAKWFLQCIMVCWFPIFARKNIKGGWIVLILGILFFIVHTFSYHIFPDIPSALHGILDYKNNSLYIGLILLGISALPSKSVSH